jgi:putative peptidoglycan lipid II flippase
MALYRSFFTVGLLTILSRLVGFIREILTATLLGASASSDALKIAIKLPALFRRIFAEGAFNASFVPTFSALLSKNDNSQDARTFAEYILGWLIVSLLILLILAEWILPSIMSFLMPGFSETPERLALAISFARITFPFIALISLTAFYSGILNSFERFVVVASSPMVGNIFIVSVVWLTVSPERNPGFDLAWAIMLSGGIQLLWVMVPLMRRGYSIRPRFLKKSTEVKTFFKKMGPAALGAGVVQVNILIDMMIASFLPTGNLSYLDYAERLNQLPLSVIGTAISTALLPMMSRYVAHNRYEDAHETQRDAIEFAMLLTIPAMCGLIIWAMPIIGMIFQHGKFTLHDTHLTAKALMAYGSGLPAYILIKIFSTTFFAYHDTKTPVKVAIGCVVLNFILNITLIGPLQHVGLAIATSISAWVNVFILAFILNRRDLFRVSVSLSPFMMRLFFTVIGVLPFLFWMKNKLDPIISYTSWWKACYMMIASLTALLLFSILAYATGALDLQRFSKHMKRI